MAEPIFRPIVFFWKDKKAAESNSFEVEFNFGAEPIYGQDGIMAYTIAPGQMRVTVREAVPIQGSTSTKDIEDIFASKSFPIAFVKGGKYYRGPVRVVTARYSSDTERGVVTGEIVMQGAIPKVFG